jgi:exonuclease VII small subunit
MKIQYPVGNLSLKHQRTRLQALRQRLNKILQRRCKGV